MIPTEQASRLFGWAQANDLALFPILPGSKQPTGIVHSHASDWSKEPSRWWEWRHANPQCNFGVSCGPSNLIVVDVDLGGEEKFAEWMRANGLDVPVTVNTPTGGKHYYFKVSSGVDSETLRQPNLCGKEVNVRAGNGYVVAPWSFTDPAADSHVKARGHYWLAEAARIYLAPQLLVEHCLGRTDTAPTIVPEIDYDLGADGFPTNPAVRHEAANRARRITLQLAVAMPGERNEKLNQAAFDLGKLVAEGKLAEWRAVDLLQETGEHIGIPRDEAKAKSTIRSGMKAAGKVGRPEPRSAMLELLAAAVPIAPVPPRPPAKPPYPDSLVPLEPLVERLLYRGQITILSGASGAGKTTFIASLMAASVSGAQDFTFGEFGATASDLFMDPCCWIFLSYEGGQHIKRTTAAWHAGSEQPELHASRTKVLGIDDGPLVVTSGRDIVVNQSQAALVVKTIEDMRALHPGMPIALVIDNATTAVENCMDPVHAQRFVQFVRSVARQDVAIVVLAHPPKSGASDIYGSHLWYSLADTVGTIEVLREEDGEWTQWIEFSKHREAKNGNCLEVRSRRLAAPLLDLPDGWGRGNARFIARQKRDLKVPFVSSIRVRSSKDKEGVRTGVTMVTEVTGKEETQLKV